MVSFRQLVLYSALALSSATSAPCEFLEADQYFGGTDHEAYLTWWNTQGGAAYNASAYFPAKSSDVTQGAALHWKVDAEYLHLAFAARAAGWIGFGIAESGGMKGSDMVYYERSKPGSLTDAFATDKALPRTDDCQDWSFVQAHQDGGFLIVQGVRKLDTKDSNDYAITHDADPIIAAQRVVVAWGDTDTISYHGTNHARGGIRWYGNGDEVTAFRRQMNEMSDGYFDLFAENHPIKNVETDYVDFCFSWTDFLDQGVPATGSISIIGAEMVLDAVGGKFVHHATIAGSTKPSNHSRTCKVDFGDYSYPLYGFSPGTMPFILPDNVAFKVGPGDDGNGIQSFRINMHYHNPELISGATDHGGLRVYFVRAPREHEMGIMFLADVFTHLEGHTLGNGLSEFRFDCGSACSSFALDEPVTVVHEYFHMHLKGAGAVQQQIRDGQVIRQASTNYFDFDQSGIHGVRQPSFQILPGDSFRTQCFYQNADDTTVFGIGSNDEMCEGLFLYYPAKRVLDVYPWGCVYDVPVHICNASVTYALHSTNDTALFRTVGTNTATDQCLDKLPDQAVRASPSAARSWKLGGWLLVSALLISVCL